LEVGNALVSHGVERVADVPIYFTDAIVRRAPSLHLTTDSKNAVKAGIPAGLFAQMQLKEGDPIKVSQGDSQVVMPATLQKGLVEGVVRIATGTPASAHLGDAFGQVVLEKV
jgi:NADH-quinone oxidoreductase subunit G